MNNDDHMPTNASPVLAVSPVQIIAENLEQNDKDLSQNNEETEGDFMPDTDGPTGSDPDDDALTDTRSGAEC